MEVEKEIQLLSQKLRNFQTSFETRFTDHDLSDFAVHQVLGESVRRWSITFPGGAEFINEYVVAPFDFTGLDQGFKVPAQGLNIKYDDYPSIIGRAWFAAELWGNMNSYKIIEDLVRQ